MQIPDLHPSVVHFPIAFLSLGSLAGLLYLHWRATAQLRILTWTPLLLGWIGALVAVFTGLLAQSGLPPTAPYRAVLNLHIYLGFAVTILYAIPLYRAWIYGKRAGKQTGHDLLDEPQARLWLSLVFGVGVLLILLTGAYGGQLVFTWGVNVNLPGSD